MSQPKPLVNTTLIIPVLNSIDLLDNLLLNYNPFFKEIIVIDSFSQDNILDACAKYSNVICYQRVYDTSAKQKNFVLDQVKTDWVFFLDVDEQISIPIIEFISIHEFDADLDLVYFSRKNFFFQKDLGHSSGYPDFQGRWFRKDRCHWETKAVHAKPIAIYNNQEPLKVKYINLDILHDDYKGLDVWWKRNHRYLKYDLIEFQKKGARWNLFKQFLGPAYIFLKLYIFKGLCLYGIKGFYVAFSESIYYFFSYWQLYELKFRK